MARYTTGSVIWWKHKIVVQSITHEVGEAMAAVEAISLAIEKGWPSVLNEGDCMLVVNDLNSSNQCLSAAGCFFHEGRMLLQRIRQFTITHVYRDKNFVAHHLAGLQMDDYEGSGTLPFYLD
ncbi:hypothetical protein OROHE_015098 [Orobanche hederae]